MMSVDELCSKDSELDYETTTSILLDWCSSDTRCVKEVLLDARGNMTIFKYFADHTIRSYSGDLFGPYKKYLCQQAEDEETAKAPESFIRSNAIVHVGPLVELWRNALIAAKNSNQIQCDLNHRLVVSKDSLTSSCERLPTVNYQTSNDSLLFFIILVAIFIVAVLILLLLIGYKMYLSSADYKKKFE
jgi:hypothetical protein